ncbi:hypothetical protein PR202_gb12581 [Eleusine coracana subsp. coracana]|uniref:Uncharacterized protein n=1 Tax=Eleusine coracana subsp. coracana TaxID=191504 RepID=A0AAV5EQ94_ELECO|nr:hypothetical protein PR202_gb12581 [Eleusine coracana subsp. coracana]
MLHVVVVALEHDALHLIHDRELKPGALGPAHVSGLVAHLHPRSCRVRINDHGLLPPIARVPDGEEHRVPLPRRGGHLLHQRRLPAGHQLHGVRVLRHRVIRQVHVLDHLRVRYNHPPWSRCTSSIMGGISTPHDMLWKMYGTTSKSPFLNMLPARLG